MKNIAKLSLFLSFSFVSILIFSTLLALLSDWTKSALVFPLDPEFTGIFTGNIANYLAFSMPPAFYLSILLGLNYATRRKIFYPLAFVIILIFALGLSGGVFFGLENLDRVGLTAIIEKPQVKFTGSGLILGSGRNQTIVLGSPNEPGRAKFVKIESVLPGNLSLSYQGQDTPLYQMRLPFFPEESGFFNSVNRDIVHNVRTFSVRYNAGYLAFGIYAGSLAAFLISLGCMVNISYWSLANLFFGARAFRGALALENFFDQRNINSLLSSFAGNMIPESFMGSIIFCALCVLILLYSGLVYLARGRISDG